MEHVIHAARFLDRVLDPLAASLNREAALSILNLRIDPEIQARVNVLAERANEGTITPDERAEYLSYVEAVDLLAIFKLKAKHHLEANGTNQQRCPFGRRVKSVRLVPGWAGGQWAFGWRTDLPAVDTARWRGEAGPVGRW